MPNDPQRRALVDAILDRLAAIRAGATYFATPAEVTGDFKGLPELIGFPTYCVVSGDETPEELTNGEIQEALEVSIAIWVSDDQDRRLALDRAIADVKRAIFTDDDLGGLALTVRHGLVRTDEAMLFAKPIAYGEVTLTVVYDHARSTV